MSNDIGRRRFVEGTAAAVAGVGLTGTASADDTAVAQETENSTEGAIETETRDESTAQSMEDGDTTLIAHRGFAGVYPENTVAAVEAASFGGPGVESAHRRANMIEVDVVPTADGTLVAFHDNGLSERDGGTRGLTDTEGIVWETDTDTVTSATVLGTDETVPTLETVLDSIPPSVGVNLEFKNPGSEDLYFAKKLSDGTLSSQKELWRPYTERVLDLASEYDNEFLVSSFYEAALATTRDVDSSVPIAFLFWDDIDEGLEITRIYDCEALNVPWNMVMGTPFFNDEYLIDGSFDDVDLIEIAHDEDRAVNTWTVSTWYQARTLADAGVDGIIADYPSVLGFQG